MRVVIAGPAGSGKSTRARELAGPGVPILDFDELARALGSRVDHHLEPHPPAIVPATLEAWRAVHRHLLAEPGSAVIIHAEPNPVALMQYADAGFRLIEMGEM